MDALEKAIKLFGTQAGLARALGVEPAAVTNWKRRGTVPVSQCKAIEQATQGQVLREELRPDMFGSPPATTDRSQDAAA